MPIVRWVLVAVAFGLSGWFLAANIYPVLASVSLYPYFFIHSLTDVRQAEAKATRLLIILLAAIHLGIAISFKVLFFSYYIMGKKIGGDLPLPGDDAGSGNTTLARLI